LQGHKKSLETVPCFRDHMLMNAETKEKRKLRLEHFFREAYALTFGLKPGEKRKFEEVTSDVIMVTYSDYYYFLIRKNSNNIFLPR
jgi:dual oxidase